MVDYLAEKVDRCLLINKSLSIIGIQLGLQKLSIIQSSGLSAIQGLRKY